MTTLSSPIGPLKINTQNDALTLIRFLSEEPETQCITDSFTQQIQQELQTYFQNPHHIFKVKLAIKGTPYQLNVWNALSNIPVGQTLTYQALAGQLKSSPRAIGNACRANPVPIIIPCHRVVARKGLGGFAGNINGQLIEIKKWLLQHERVASTNR